MEPMDKSNQAGPKRDYPFSSREKNNLAIDEDIFEFSNSCSSTDCTGLIPSAPVEDGTLESYEELYPFLPPH